MSRSTLLITLAMLMLAGCGSKGPVLTPKDARAPANVDFSGLWQLRPAFADTTRRIDEIAGRAVEDGNPLIRSRDRAAENQRRSSRRRAGSLLHVFLENGSTLKITQTDYAVFVSFDRAVVEEYEFGEHGVVSVGEVIAERAAGWEGSRFVVETADGESARLTETYTLGADDEVLVRSIRLVLRKQAPVEFEQVFDRVE